MMVDHQWISLSGMLTGNTPQKKSGILSMVSGDVPLVTPSIDYSKKGRFLVMINPGQISVWQRHQASRRSDLL